MQMKDLIKRLSEALEKTDVLVISGMDVDQSKLLPELLMNSGRDDTAIFVPTPAMLYCPGGVKDGSCAVGYKGHIRSLDGELEVLRGFGGKLVGVPHSEVLSEVEMDRLMSPLSNKNSDRDYKLVLITRPCNSSPLYGMLRSLGCIDSNGINNFSAIGSPRDLNVRDVTLTHIPLNIFESGVVSKNPPYAKFLDTISTDTKVNYIAGQWK